MVDKKKVENVIIKAFEGNISGKEAENILAILRNYSLEEWRNLIKVFKEIVKEKGVEEIQKLSEKDMSSEWKSICKDLGYAVVDLAAYLLNEEFWHRIVSVEKKSGLSDEEKIQKILPILNERMDKISSRAGSSNLSKAEYYRAETKVNKMFKKVFREVKLAYINGELRKLKNIDITDLGEKKGKQLLDTLGNLSTAEIVVLKDKIKALIDMLIKNYAPAEIKNSPEIKQSINSFLNLVGAVADEKVVKEGIDLVVKFRRAVIRNPKLLRGEEKRGKYSVHYEWNPITQFRKAGLEQEFKSFIKNLTSHLNKLAGQGEEDNSPVNREEVIQKLTSSLPEPTDNPNPNENDEPNSKISVTGLLTNNVVVKAVEDTLKNADGEPEKAWNVEEVSKDIEKILTQHQAEGEWYQKTWVIVSLIVGAFLIGGLVVWLFLRKKNQPVKEE